MRTFIFLGSRSLILHIFPWMFRRFTLLLYISALIHHEIFRSVSQEQFKDKYKVSCFVFQCLTKKKSSHCQMICFHLLFSLSLFLLLFLLFFVELSRRLVIVSFVLYTFTLRSVVVGTRYECKPSENFHIVIILLGQRRLSDSRYCLAV